MQIVLLQLKFLLKLKNCFVAITLVGVDLFNL